MSKLLKGIGNGIRRMLWFKVAPAIIAIDILVETLGRGAMITEHQVASMLGCGRDHLKKGPMSYQRKWKKIDIGFISENGNTMHYENNTPPFYVAPVVHREAYKLNSAVFAVLAHDIKALMGGRIGYPYLLSCRACMVWNIGRGLLGAVTAQEYD